MFLFCFQVYKGYVDDLRNMDNVWMEIVVVNFYDDIGEVFNEFKLQVDCFIFQNVNKKWYMLSSIFCFIIYRLEMMWLWCVGRELVVIFFFL